MTRTLIAFTTLTLIFTLIPAIAAPPRVGDKAPALELKNLDGKKITLQGLLEDSPVALIFLRGWNGYQCPICTRQVGEFISQAEAFKKRDHAIVFIYPGKESAGVTGKHATDFTSEYTLPDNIHFLTDPGLKAGKSFDLIWEGAKETVYPSLYLIAKDGTVRFSKVSKSHGGRVSAVDALTEIDNL